jgi:hypothetical protein
VSNSLSGNAVPPSLPSSSRAATTVEAIDIQSHLMNDIEATRDVLHDLAASQGTSLGALASLSKACAAVWHNSMEFDSNVKGFFLFEDRAEFWAESRAFVQHRSIFLVSLT